jgi:hypothetical protein
VTHASPRASRGPYPLQYLDRFLTPYSPLRVVGCDAQKCPIRVRDEEVYRAEVERDVTEDDVRRRNQVGKCPVQEVNATSTAAVITETIHCHCYMQMRHMNKPMQLTQNMNKNNPDAMHTPMQDISPSNNLMSIFRRLLPLPFHHTLIHPL